METEQNLLVLRKFREIVVQSAQELAPFVFVAFELFRGDSSSPEARDPLDIANNGVAKPGAIVAVGRCLLWSWHGLSTRDVSRSGGQNMGCKPMPRKGFRLIEL